MVSFDITLNGPAQTKGTQWSAKPKGSAEAPFLIGATVPYSDADGAHRGLYQPNLKKIPQLYYDRHAAAASIGLWAHFIWPTVTAEGGGHHLVVNTYDRARFTFGFYQLAAHTPNDNLILLFRELLTLDKAKDYFPDLSLVGGRVHRTDAGATYSLESETQVHRPNGKVETQIVGFMSYLNPDTTTAGEAEALTAAKLMHWLLNDPTAVEASVKVAFGIMRRKVRAAAQAHGLKGKDPRLGIWVSDIIHQSRGTSAQITAALGKSDLAKQLQALSEIGEDKYPERSKTIRSRISTLDGEQAFSGVSLGDAKLPLT